MILSRREMFKLLAAGATVVAGEIFIPGNTLISIPPTREVFLYGVDQEGLPFSEVLHYDFTKEHIERLALSEDPGFTMKWFEKLTRATKVQWTQHEALIKSYEPIPYPLSKAFSDKGMHIQQPPQEALDAKVHRIRQS